MHAQVHQGEHCISQSLQHRHARAPALQVDSLQTTVELGMNKTPAPAKTKETVAVALWLADHFQRPPMYLSSDEEACFSRQGPYSATRSHSQRLQLHNRYSHQERTCHRQPKSADGAREKSPRSPDDSTRGRTSWPSSQNTRVSFPTKDGGRF
jgi:hypothetical protein